MRTLTRRAGAGTSGAADLPHTDPQFHASDDPTEGYYACSHTPTTTRDNNNYYYFIRAEPASATTRGHGKVWKRKVHSPPRGVTTEPKGVDNATRPFRCYSANENEGSPGVTPRTARRTSAVSEAPATTHPDRRRPASECTEDLPNSAHSLISHETDIATLKLVR